MQTTATEKVAIINSTNVLKTEAKRRRRVDGRLSSRLRPYPKDMDAVENSVVDVDISHDQRCHYNRQSWNNNSCSKWRLTRLILAVIPATVTVHIFRIWIYSPRPVTV